MDNTKTMTKADLVDILFTRMGMNKREAKDMVDAFFDEIRAALEDGRTATRLNVRVVSLRPVKKSPLRHAVW